LGRPRGLRVAAIYGGTGFGAQLKALRRGVDVLVACPGRLVDLIERREVGLDAVEVVIVDEADRMADMGFLPVVRRILDATPDTRQTLLFSATLDGAVDVLIRRYQRDPVRHILPEDTEERSRATHMFWRVARDDRVRLCADVVKLAGPTIVFCRTKRGASQLARKLEEHGVRTEAIHGNRTQAQREQALAAFAHGRVDALVATDVAARGIHVDDVACVVHFDPPADAKDYTHRSGRTARAGSLGTIVSLVQNEGVKEAARLQRALGLRPGLGPPDRAALASITPGAVSERRLGVTVPPPDARSATPTRSDRSGPRGTIKWFDSRRGFGFIERHDGEDLFVHWSAVEGETTHPRLEAGQSVEYELGAGRKGQEARRVRVLSATSA
jgi:superfamily II DNA/RNA helicase/cold shock CspA family protein